MDLRRFYLLAALVVSLSVAMARNPEPTMAAIWKVKAGDTLTHIAVSRYGSDAYAGFLEKFNRVKPRRLHLDMQLATFDFAVAMEKCEATAAAPKVAPLLGELTDEFGAVSKLIKEARKESSSVKKLSPLPKETLDRLTKVQGQAADVRNTVGESKLPKSLKKSLGDRFGMVDDLLKAIVVFEKEQKGPFHSTGARSLDRIHHQLDGALCEILDYTRRSYE